MLKKELNQHITRGSMSIEYKSAIQFDVTTEVHKIKEGQIYFWKWICQLSELTKQDYSPDQWELLGHGLVIESKDYDLTKQYARLACESIGVRFKTLNYSQIMKLDELPKVHSSIPEIFFIERDDWYLSIAEEDQALANQINLARYMRGLKGESVIFILTAESYADISTDFREEGIFDRHIQWLEPQPKLMAEDLIQSLGVELFEQSVVAAMHRVGCLLCAEFSTSRKYGLLKSALRRIAYFENRKINWKDLFHIIANGTGEGYESPKNIDNNKIAAHEAGHALAAIIESRGENIPDVTTILPGNRCFGVVIDDLEYMYQTDGCLSFEGACIKIRIALAGRASEELIFGPMGVDVFWSRDDLKQATRIALDLVAKGGFDHKYADSSSGGINLLVCGDYSYKEDDFYKNEAKIFLASQYEIIRACLSKNRPLLDRIIDTLLEVKFLDQDDMKKLVSKNNSAIPLAA